MNKKIEKMKKISLRFSITFLFKELDFPNIVMLLKKYNKITSRY